MESAIYALKIDHYHGTTFVFSGARTLEDVLDQMSEHSSDTEEEQKVARMNIAHHASGT